MTVMNRLIDEETSSRQQRIEHCKCMGYILAVNLIGSKIANKARQLRRPG